MAEELFIPQLGQTVEEVTLISWYVKDGEQVKQGQEVLEVETDKAVFDVEATGDGFIHFGPYEVGDVVPVLTVVALIGEKDEQFKVKESTGEEKKADTTQALAEKAVRKKTEVQSVNKGEKVFASPRARKLAVEKEIDLAQVKASGGGGVRITEEDVRRYLEHSGATAAPEIEVIERVPLRGVRGVIAERMAASSQETARVALFMDADATALVKLREKLKAEKAADWEYKPGYNDLLVKACSAALREFPYMNARLNGDTIERLAVVNIGVAVDDERGLYVPVIKDADKKDLRTIGFELRGHVEAVRSGKIAPDNLRGGTFTITNLGGYGVEGFTPVINLPEAAILGIGRIAKRAVVVEGKVTAREMITLSLVFDHRLVDGAPAARFLQFLKELIENANEGTLAK